MDFFFFASVNVSTLTLEYNCILLQDSPFQKKIEAEKKAQISKKRKKDNINERSEIFLE